MVCVLYLARWGNALSNSGLLVIYLCRNSFPEILEKRNLPNLNIIYKLFIELFYLIFNLIILKITTIMIKEVKK